MLHRFRMVAKRYGQRTPFVVAAIALSRGQFILKAMRLVQLRLVTKGDKGKSINLESNLQVSHGSLLTIGDHCHIGKSCRFHITVNPAGQVRIGARSWLSDYCLIAASQRIEIGSDVLVGEFVSIRDSSHRYDGTEPINQQGDWLGTITIEDDVWIGRGCLIQGRPEGIRIGRGAIVGANSVVQRSIPAGEIWGGVPARFIKHRWPTDGSLPAGEAPKPLT